MKDKYNVLRQLDEIDNMIFILVDLAGKQTVEKNESISKLTNINRKITIIFDRIIFS